jgi:hypothetical protein
VVGVTAWSFGDCIVVVDPILEVDPSNPDVTLEFPNTVADPDAQAPLAGFTPEDFLARGLDPQPFMDLGFFEPTPTPPSDPPPPPPPASDTVAPTTTAVSTPAGLANGWNRTPVTVMLNASDDPGGSGVKEIHVSLSGASSGSGIVAGGTASFGIVAEGATLVTYFAIDHAGNQGSPQTLTLRIDRTPPTLTGMPTDCVLPVPDHRLVHVATVSVDDNGSGSTGDPQITVTSNEPAAGLGEDDQTPDAIVDGGGVKLRAERAGNGTGRVYTIRAVATDLAGNTATATSVCRVPHDSRPIAPR